MEEIWKDIVGYEGYYQISNIGRVRSVERIDQRNHKRGGYFMKNTIFPSGYLYVSLYKDGVSKQFRIHRLVAEHFIVNPNNLPFVNHKDEDKLNNNADNLEWCTNEYNLNYGTRNKRAGNKLKNRKDKSKEILQIFDDGVIIEYKSIMEANRKLDISRPYIQVLLKNGKKYKNYYFVYK